MTDRARHHQDPAAARLGPVPWRHGRPRRTLVAPHIQKNFTEPWLPACRRQSPDGLRCGRSAVTAAGDGDPASNSVQLVAAPVTLPSSLDRRRPSGEGARYVERLAPPSGCGSRRASLCANALAATMLLVLAFRALVETLGLGQKRTAKFAASTNAQARYLLPFLAVLSPFFLRLLVCTLSTQRAWDAKLLASANRSIGPVSRTMTVASVWPMPGTVVNKAYCVRGLTRSCRRFSRTSICDCSVAITATLAVIAKPTAAQPERYRRHYRQHHQPDHVRLHGRGAAFRCRPCTLEWAHLRSIAGTLYQL
jgi:hypothetical protein